MAEFLANIRSTTPALLTDAAPKSVLKGRIVTMDESASVMDGFICIEGNRIAALAAREADLPAAFSGTPVIDTGGTIFPGLIELHNHLSYNFMPLWDVPRQFTDRNQWRADPGYRARVQIPAGLIARNVEKDYPRSIARFVECRALFGGVTTSQGIGSNRGHYSGLIRNVEAPGDPAFPAAGGQTLDYRTAEIEAELVPALRRGRPFFYHLSEGTDDGVRQRFLDLEYRPGQWAIAPNLIPIHCVALRSGDFARLDEAAGMVWSPLSNYLLYGRTADVAAAKARNMTIALGSDWSPSGSKNLLGELKVARLASAALGNLFSDEDLVRMVTANPARMLGWQAQVGTLEAGKQADLVVVHGTAGDPYRMLIDALEDDIVLVMIAGRVRLARLALVGFDPQQQEVFRIGGNPYSLDLVEAGTDPLAGLSLATARDKLASGLENLPALARRGVEQAGLLQDSLMAEPLSIDLELDDTPGEGPALFFNAAALAADADLSPLQLEPITEVDDRGYRARLRANRNVPDFLRDGLA